MSVGRLLSAMAIFVEYPLLATAVGVLLFELGRRTRRRIPLGVGALWLLYSAYETAMQRRWLCSGECDIRVDLLLIYPVLLISSAAAGLSLFQARRKPNPPA
jgi:hypothetical protein